MQIVPEKPHEDDTIKVIIIISTPPRLGSHFPGMESSEEKLLGHIAMVATFLGMTTNRKRVA